MFFKLVYRNAKRTRNENLVYIFTLVIAIASFYIILSLEEQSVMQFLRTMESDAVNSLFELMPILYLFALFLLFSLILFANNYQLDRRSKEFGVYLLLGMKQTRISWLLIVEAIFTTLIALVIGIGTGAIIAEVISLVTSRLIGQGLIGYQASFSWQAVIYTAIGFAAVQLLALIIASYKLFRPEIKSLLDGKIAKKQDMGTVKTNAIIFVVGVLLLAVAYWMAINGFTGVDFIKLLLAVILGIVGTISLIRGIAPLLNQYIIRKRDNHGLQIFTVRQLQESVAGRPVSIAVCSILLMLAMMFLAQGASYIRIYNNSNAQDASVYHFTVVPNYGVAEDNQKIERILTEEPVASYVTHLNKLEIGNTSEPGLVSVEPFVSKVMAMLPEELQTKYQGELMSFYIGPDQSPEENLLVRLLMQNSPYLIPVSSYNRLLEAAGDQPLDLASNQAAFYFNPSIDASLLNQLVSEANNNRESLMAINQEEFELVPLENRYNLVTDRSITISTAYVVPDTVFDSIIIDGDGHIMTYWNFLLPDAIVDQEGLMAPMQHVSQLLSGENVAFESYLNSYGRQLFYIVAGSYTFFYMSFLFLLISSSVIGLQFLTQLKQNNRRYQSLLFIGAKDKQIQQSVRNQVAWTFLFPLIPAIFSGTAGIIAMNYYAIENATFLESINDNLHIILMMTGAFILIQWGYAYVIYRASLKEVREQQFMERIVS